jgi:Domain of unknown function (DUF4167)
MRPGQNKRIRGRNNRRGPNPLTRSYESNGPDVKVRGTAQHVAEKYTQLARDAHVSGDPVMAESYLQHAEHYYRLIAAAHQAQIAIQNGTADDRDDEDDDFDTASDRFTFRAVQQGASGGQPSERASGETGEAGEASEGDDGTSERPPQPERQQGRSERPHGNDRHNNNRNRGPDRNFRPNGERDRSAERGAFQDRNQERGGFNPNRPRRPQPDLEGAEQPVLPAFLTAPVRAVPVEASEAPAPMAETAPGIDEGLRTPFRARRRRRPRIAGEGPELQAEAAGSDQD